MIVGCYSLHLYCEKGDKLQQIYGECDYFAEIAGETRAECFAKARKAGWRLSWKKSECICPVHTGVVPKRPSLMVRAIAASS